MAGAAVAAGSLEAALVHIYGAIDLDLKRVAAVARRAIVLGDETAGIRLVAHHAKAFGAEQLFEQARDLLSAGSAVAVAEHDIYARPAMHAGMRAGGRGHRVAIQEKHIAERLIRPADEVGKHPV